jgi:tyrosine-protein phosphatase YwqE
MSEGEEESVQLVMRQVSWGFERIVCTSHRTRLYQNTPETVSGACEALQRALNERGVGVELVPSMEYRLIPETWPETLQKGWLMPWEGNHILVELPISNPLKIGDIVPEDEIRRLLDMGYQPVLAHPERYLYLDMERYKSLKAAGALFQGNIGSLEGLYGQSVSLRARQIRESLGFDLFGTDLHYSSYANFFDSFVWK